MSELGLFLVGLGVSIPAGVAIVGLILAAVADGRANDEMQTRIAADEAPTG